MWDDAEMHRPRRTRSQFLAAIFALIAALLLVALLVLVQRSIHSRDAALARKQHSFNILLLTSEVQGALANGESALPRFLISGDPEIATLYYDAWRSAGNLIDQLRRQVRDDPAQRERVRRLAIFYQTRADELAGPTLLANYKKGWSALLHFSEVRRTDALAGISRELGAIADDERARLDEREVTAAERVMRSDMLVQALSIVGLLLVLSAIASGWLALSAFAARREARDQAEAEHDRAGALEIAVAQRTVELSDANLRLRREADNRAEAEGKLRQIQKMEAVGQLTGGIAHDFNNMLAVVLGGLELARKRVTEQAAEATRHIDSAMEGASRAAALTRRLLSFARAEPLVPASTDAGELIHGMADLIDRTIGERVEVRIAHGLNLWPIWIDRYQLENAILNLCVNARDAMDASGLLRLEATNARLGDGECGHLIAGDYVRIAVTDDGAGMAPEVLDRVFEPFFTTKPIGQGTGLGLSQIFSFARQSGGDVSIQSAPGFGTTVSLLLPRHREGAGLAERVTAAAPVSISSRIAPSPTAPSLARRAPVAKPVTATILIVEDDVRVRSATSDALADIGYRPIACGSGDEALRLLEDRDDIALLLTDVMMPVMTGTELAECIAERYPALPILFCTGFVGEAGDAEQLAGHGVLRKPFTLAQLGAAVTDTLRIGAVTERAA